jgi:hypothetical protein
MDGQPRGDLDRPASPDPRRALTFRRATPLLASTPAPNSPRSFPARWLGGIPCEQLAPPLT